MLFMGGFYLRPLFSHIGRDGLDFRMCVRGRQVDWIGGLAGAYWRIEATQLNAWLTFDPIALAMNRRDSRSPSMAAYSATAWPCSEWKSFPLTPLMSRFFTEFTADHRGRSGMPPGEDLQRREIKHSEPRQAPHGTGAEPLLVTWSRN
jgi:hypothetical protein